MGIITCSLKDAETLSLNLDFVVLNSGAKAETCPTM